MPLKVEIKQRLPGSVAARAGFQLGQIQISLGELSQALIQGGRLIARREYDRGLVVVRGFWIAVAHQKESRIIIGLVLDFFSDNLQTIKLRRQFRRDGAHARPWIMGEIMSRAGRIVPSHRFQIVAFQKSLALHQGLRVRANLHDIIQGRTGNPQQGVMNVEDHFRLDTHIVIEQHFVSAADRARQSVLHRQQAIISIIGLNSVEEAIKILARQAIHIGPEMLPHRDF